MCDVTGIVERKAQAEQRRSARGGAPPHAPLATRSGSCLGYVWERWFALFSKHLSSRRCYGAEWGVDGQLPLSTLTAGVCNASASIGVKPVLRLRAKANPWLQFCPGHIALNPGPCGGLVPSPLERHPSWYRAGGLPGGIPGCVVDLQFPEWPVAVGSLV